MRDIVDENRKTHFRDIDVKRYHTGIDRIDTATGGLEGGDVVVIAGRPGTGKSALSDQIALSMAESGLNVAIYNLEMKEKQVKDLMDAVCSDYEYEGIKIWLS